MRSIVQTSFALLALVVLEVSASLRTRFLQAEQTEFGEQAARAKEEQNSENPETEHDLHQEDWGTRGSDLVKVMNHYADLWEPYDSSRDTAFFWMVPKSGTTTLGSYMANCLDLVTANRVGSMYLGDTLEIVKHQDHRYVNVDVTSHEGLEHARRVGLAEKAVADVIVSGSVVHLASIFNTHNKARMFTLMRDPIERTVSEFYYIQVAEWERQYKPFLKDWTIEQYVNSQYFVNNSMVRTLTGKRSSKMILGSQDLTKAKEVLARKCLIGLTSNYQESVERFKAYFGWEDEDNCLEKLFAPGGGGNTNSNKHRSIDPGSGEYDTLREVQIWDVRLYMYAIELFEEQKRLFASKPEQ